MLIFQGTLKKSLKQRELLFHGHLLTDNFEWNYGYRDRFGLVYIDFRTQKRYRKDSSYWYEELIKSNGKSLIRETER